MSNADMNNNSASAALNSCAAVCWILAFAAGLFVAAVCVYWAGMHGLVSAVIGLIALMGAGYLFPMVFCAGREVAPEIPARSPETELPVVPTADPVAAPAAVQETGGPQLYDKKPDVVDNLKAITGVGPALEKKLNDLGVYRYSQIAAWTREDVDWVDDQLKFHGRIWRDDWVQQAKMLAEG